jgi:hypothetical protein
MLRPRATWTLLASCFGLVMTACSGDSAQDIGQSDATPEAAGDGATGDDSTGGDDSSAFDSAPPPPDAGVDGPSPADLVAFCDNIYGAVATSYEGCCNAADKANVVYQYLDAILHLEVTDCEQTLGGSATNGRIAFDPASAASCESEFHTYLGQVKCPIFNDSNQTAGSAFAAPPCSNVVTGLQPIGSPCAQDYECQQGLTCVGWTQTSDGTCQTPPSTGSPCGPELSDAGTSPLDFGFGGHPKCVSGNFCYRTCIAQFAGGTPCIVDEECQPPLTCSLEQCQSSSGPSAQGGPCAQLKDCQNGLYCQLGPDGGAGSCQTKETAGSTCQGGLSSNQCDGLCEAPEAGAAGQCAAFCGSN